MSPLSDTKKPYFARANLLALALLLLLHAAAVIVSLRYAYIATDLLAATEAAFLIGAMMLLSPLITYLRLAFLLWTAFYGRVRRALPMLCIYSLSLLCAAGLDLFLSSKNDPFFDGNEPFYFISASLSFTVGLAVALAVCFIAARQGRRAAEGAKKRGAMIASALWASVITYLVDAAYRSYTVLSMAFSEGGLSFADTSDILYLLLDYALPLCEAALGFGFTCLCFLLFERILVKSS